MANTRKRYIVGNWKMNPDSIDEARYIAQSVERMAKKSKSVSVIIAPPAPFLSIIGRTKRSTILSAQDVAPFPDGAHTGSVSAKQMKNVGATYTIIGHSECRRDGDDDTIVAQKMILALEAGLRVILCVGEEARDSEGRFLSDLRSQILSALSNLPKKYMTDFIIAYEPVWAVGGDFSEILTPHAIHEMTIYIRKVLSEIIPRDEAMRVSVLYGGSVDFDNARAILDDGEVSGLLIGRRSLDATEFNQIVSYANSL